MSQFSEIIASAYTLLRSAAGETVTYHRGEHSVSLDAVPGATVYDATVGDDVTVEGRTRDYVIVAADLVLDDEQVMPERGDTIRHEINGDVHVWEAIRFGEQVWCYSDHGQTAIRVHTRLKSIETEEESESEEE